MKKIHLDLPDINPVALLIRHAERFPLNDMREAIKPLLTEKGKKDAFDLGLELLSFCPVKIFHSPVERCRQTAEGISIGITSGNYESTISGPLFDLGGPYILGNWEELLSSVDEFGQLGFIRKWFNDELPTTHIMSLKEAAENLAQVLINLLNTETCNTVSVTHDWNLMILREYYFNISHEDAGIPGYLDGIAAFFANGSLRLNYHGTEVSVKIPDSVT
jgi:hypothetical protein